MKSYLTALFITSLAVAVAGLLSPEGARGGLARGVRLVGALALICVLIAPLGDVLVGLRAISGGDISLPPEWDMGDNGTDDQLDMILGESARTYVAEMLTQTLEREFGIAVGDVRCSITWKTEDGGDVPTEVRVALSGRAIWKDAHAIADHVQALLGCPCITVIE